MRLTLLLFSIFLLAAKKPLLFNGTAAKVGGKVLTVGDAYTYRSLVRFQDGESSAVRFEEGEELTRTVQKAVLNEIVLQEMKTYKFEGMSRKVAEKWLEGEKAKGREKNWLDICKTFGYTEDALLGRLWDILRVEEFIQKKVDTLTPIVTEAEAEKYFRQNEARFRGTSFDTMKANIIVLLKKQETQRGLEEWIRGLREKYVVTSLLGG